MEFFSLKVVNESTEGTLWCNNESYDNYWRENLKNTKIESTVLKAVTIFSLRTLQKYSVALFLLNVVFQCENLDECKAYIEHYDF